MSRHMDARIHPNHQASATGAADAFTHQKQRERRLAIQMVDRRIGLPMKYALIPVTLLAVWVLEPEAFVRPPFYIGFGLFVGGTVLLTYLYRLTSIEAFQLVLIGTGIEEVYLSVLATSTGASTVDALVVLSAAPILKADLLSITLTEYLVTAFSASMLFLGSCAALDPVPLTQFHFWWAFFASWVIIVTGRVILDSLMKQREERLVITEQRGLLLRRMIDAQEEERKRIARELHDETSQAVAAVMMHVEAAEAMLSATPLRTEEVRARLTETRALAAETMDVVHRMAFDLRPTLLDDLGLIPAIRAYAKLHVEQAGLAVNCEAAGFHRRLSPDLEVILFRVIQEALTNVVKYARARTVDLVLTWHGGTVTAVVQDDGRGFDVEQVLTAGNQAQHLGITGMHERVTLAGGTFAVQSRLGEGTRIIVELPVDGEVEHDE